jgi:hypothetical protein
MLGDTFGDTYNANATANALFRWHDRNGDTLYQPGEVDLNPNGLDIINITSASTSVRNPNLKQPRTWEGTASFERELAPNLGFRTMYVYRRLAGYLADPGPNILRPYDVYSIPITRRDPGPDGILGTADDGAPVTFFDYQPAYRGAAFVANQVSNYPNDDRFHSVEFTLTKRTSGRWSAQASGFVVKNHRWLARTDTVARLCSCPNDAFFPLDDTWNWASIVTGSYRLPGDVLLSAFLQAKTGVLGQRTNIFRMADPDRGRPIAQLNTVTLRLEPYGARSLAAIDILNLRAGREFALAAGMRVGIDLDVFNVLNSNAPTSATFASGPTFGYATAVLPARIARVGARLRF